MEAAFQRTAPIDCQVKLMATSVRHNDLVSHLTGKLYNLSKEKTQFDYWSDTVALVYDDGKLIDVAGTRIEEITKISRKIDTLPFKEPDIMVFKENPFIINRNDTKVAGTPNLIIEVWSKDNDNPHRDEKFNIYSSSDKTEHWYIDFNSNIFRCFIGKKRLPDQHLRNVLKTQCGLTFDLRRLDNGDDESWNDFVMYGYK